MAGRGEISWKMRTAEGERREYYARLRGGRWRFYARSRRFERWEPLPEPSLAEWLKLLDGVQRRVPRRLCDPEEPERIRREIQRRFPEAEL